MKMKHMTRVAAAILALAMVLGLATVLTVGASAATTSAEDVEAWDGTTYPESLAGSGTEEDPYIIGGSADFAYFYKNTSSTDTSYYKMTGDVRFTDAKNLDTIMGAGNLQPDFGGVLDGNGHTVYNIKRTGYSGTRRVFGTVTGTIKNMTFDGIYLSTGLNQPNHVFDGLADGGTLSGLKFLNLYLNASHVALIHTCRTGDVTVENVMVQGKMISNGSGAYVGGLLGRVDGPGNSITLRNITVDVDFTIKSTSFCFGGIISGLNKESYQNTAMRNSVSAENCTAKGSVSFTASNSTGNYIGGFVGQIGCYFKTLTLTGCTNMLDFAVTGTGVGGVGGFIGGVSGANNNIQAAINTFTDCVNVGNIAVATDAMSGGAGGFIGSNGSTNRGCCIFNNCAQLGDVSSSVGNVGGLVGKLGMDYNSAYSNASAFYINSCVVKGTVSGGAYAGGLIGWGNSGTPTGARFFDVRLVSSVMDVTVTGTTETAVTGLFVAGTDKTKIIDKITVDSNSYVNETMERFSHGDKTKADFAATYTPAAWDASVLTDGTAVASLNGYAVANGYTPWVQGSTLPVYITAVKFSGASMSLGSEMALNMKVKADVFGTLDVVGVQVINGKTGTPVDATLTDGYYTAALTGIRAADMGNEMELYLVVTVGEKQYVSSTATLYSPLTYAERMYGKTETPANVKTLLLAMVQYGDAAEVNLRETSTIKSDFMTATGAVESDFPTTLPTGYTRDDVDPSGINAVAEVGATLTSGVNLVFRLTDSGVTSLRVVTDGLDKTYVAVDGYITVTDLHAGMIHNKLTLTFMSGESETATATYSIGNFLAGRVGTGETAAEQLAAATVIYMDAVRSYALAQN